MNDFSAKKIIKEYIDKNPNKILLFSLKEFAAEIAFSEPAVVKSLKQLGFEGFKDLKKKLFVKQQVNVKAQEDQNLVVQSIIATDRRLIDRNSIQNLLQAIEGKKIAVQGFGDMLSIAHHLSQTLARNGYPCIPIEFKESLDYFDIDILIMISSRGISQINKEVIMRAKELKKPIILITDSSSQFSDLVDDTIEFICFHDSAKRESKIKRITLIYYVISKITELINSKK